MLQKLKKWWYAEGKIEHGEVTVSINDDMRWPATKQSWIARSWIGRLRDRIVARWRWQWMSKAERRQAEAFGKLFFNLMANAPIDKILAGEGCSWSITPKQEQGAKEGLKEYVKEVTGEDVQVAATQIATKAEGGSDDTDQSRSSNG